jgi:hypothetical protein
MSQSRLKRKRKQWLHDFQRDHESDIKREENKIREQLKKENYVQI